MAFSMEFSGVLRRLGCSGGLAILLDLGYNLALTKDVTSVGR